MHITFDEGEAANRFSDKKQMSPLKKIWGGNVNLL